MYVVQKVDEVEYGKPVYRYRRIDDKTEEVRLMSVKVYLGDVINPVIIPNVEAIDIIHDDDNDVITSFKYLQNDSKKYAEFINVVGYSILPEEG